MTSTMQQLAGVCTVYGEGVQAIITTVRTLKEFVVQIDALLGGSAGVQCSANQAALSIAKVGAEGIRSAVKPLLPDRRKLGRKICKSAGKIQKMLDNIISLLPENGCIIETETERRRRRRRNKRKDNHRQPRMNNGICKRFTKVMARYETGLEKWMPRLDTAATDLAQAATLGPLLESTLNDVAATVTAAATGTCLT